MGLFRVLSLLPKKRPICFSLLPTTHINMYSAYPFCLHFFHLLCFVFVFLCLLLPLVTVVDENRMHLTPFHSQKMNLRNTIGVYCGFQERGESVNLYCKAFTARITLFSLDSKSVMEQTVGASVEKGENRDDPPVLWLSKGWLSQSCVVSK